MGNVFAFGIPTAFFPLQGFAPRVVSEPSPFSCDRHGDNCAGHPVLHYIDDLVIGARTLKELEGRVSALLRTLEHYGLQVQKSKFVFGRREITFLGLELIHLLSS